MIAWRLRERRRTRVLAAAALVTAAVLLLLVTVTRGDGSGPQVLVQSEATPTAAVPMASVAPTPTPTVTQSAQDGPSASTPPSGPRAEVRAREHYLLPQEFLAATFAQGRRSPLMAWGWDGWPPNGGGEIGQTCYGHASQKTLGAPRGIVGEITSWPDEIVVTTVLAAEDSLADAKTRFARCAGRFAGDAKSRDLDVGDQGFLLTRTEALTTEMYSGARVGVALVLVDVRQSGRLSSSAPLENALHAAVRRATGYDEGSPVAAPPQRVPSSVRGYVSRTALANQDSVGLVWLTDRPGDVKALSCADQGVSTTAAPAARLFGFEGGPSYTLRIGVVPDVTTAKVDFARCKKAFRAAGGYIIDNQPYSGMGDEWFEVVNVPREGGGYELPIVVSRLGGVFFRFEGDMNDPDELMPSAIEAYERAAG